MFSVEFDIGSLVFNFTGVGFHRPHSHCLQLVSSGIICTVLYSRTQFVDRFCFVCNLKVTLFHTQLNLLGASNGVLADVLGCREVEVPFRVEQAPSDAANACQWWDDAQLRCLVHSDTMLACILRGCVNRRLEVSCTGSGRSIVHFVGVDGVFG